MCRGKKGVCVGGARKGCVGHAYTVGCTWKSESSFVNSLVPFLLYVRLNLTFQVLYQALFTSPAPGPSWRTVLTWPTLAGTYSGSWMVILVSKIAKPGSLVQMLFNPVWPACPLWRWSVLLVDAVSPGTVANIRSHAWSLQFSLADGKLWPVSGITRPDAWAESLRGGLFFLLSGNKCSPGQDSLWVSVSLSVKEGDFLFWYCRVFLGGGVIDVFDTSSSWL